MSIIIPTVLPSVASATKEIVARLTRRWNNLGGMCPSADLLADIEDVWVVGSTVWRPALGHPWTTAPQGDLDLVFETEASKKKVIARAVAWGRSLLDGYWTLEGDGYYHDAQRVVTQGDPGHKGRRVLIDAWVVPGNLTVEEHVLSFTHQHQRVALRPDGTLFRGIRRGEAPDHWKGK